MHSGLLQLFLSICIQKVTKTCRLFLQKNRSQIFVTIINGKRTGHKQLIAINDGTVYRYVLFTQLNIHVKVRKTTAAFFASACGILRRLDFRRRALAPFNNEENK
jgi:hypothetical protein